MRKSKKKIDFIDAVFRIGGNRREGKVENLTFFDYYMIKQKVKDSQSQRR